MGKYNKTELDTQIDNALVATLDLSEHATLLKDSVADSAELKKRRVTATTETGGSYTLNFQDIEEYDIAVNTVNTSFTVSNLSEGQEGWLKIRSKGSALITFTNVTLVGNNKGNVNIAAITYDFVAFKIINIRGSYYAYFFGIPDNSPGTFDWENFHGYTTDLRLEYVQNWSNGPFSPASPYIINIRTTYDPTTDATLYDAVFYRIAVHPPQFWVGSKYTSGSIAWTQIS